MLPVAISKNPRSDMPWRTVLVAYNILLAVFLGWIFAYNVLDFPYKLGADGQKVRCLPWSVFIIKDRRPDHIAKGDLIQFRGGDVGYGLSGLLWVKIVGAVPGDTVEIKNDQLFVNGVFYDKLWLLKTLRKESGYFDKTFVVPPGEYLMLGTAQESFDSRYWGTIKKEQIIGSAIPLF